MTKKSINKAESLVVTVEIRGTPTQLKPVAMKLASLLTDSRFGVNATPTESLLQALHPASEDLLSAFSTGHLNKNIRAKLLQHWGGLPHPEFPQATLWNIGGRENISLEIPVMGELGATLAALSSTNPDLLIYCDYTFLDAESGEKKFEVPVRVSSARYINGELESTREWRGG